MCGICDKMQVVHRNWDVTVWSFETHTHPPTKLNNFMIERKLKNRKFCRGVHISNRGSKSARTLRRCKFLKNLPTTASVGIVAKAYIWFFLPRFLTKMNCLPSRLRPACRVFLRGSDSAFDLDIPEDIQLWVLHYSPLHFSNKICSLTFVAGRVFLHHLRCDRSYCRKRCWLKLSHISVL